MSRFLYSAGKEMVYKKKKIWNPLHSINTHNCLILIIVLVNLILYFGLLLHLHGLPDALIFLVPSKHFHNLIKKTAKLQHHNPFYFTYLTNFLAISV